MRRFLLFLFVLASCGNAPYRGAGVCGADDFVIDSYQVREGKFAILEMDGKCFACLEDELLDEYMEVIGEGDLLSISLHHPSRSDLMAALDVVGKNMGFRVCDGAVSLPGLAPICVEGLTLEEARKKIESTYRDEIADVDIFLSFKGSEGRQIELMGMVSAPKIVADGKKRLFEVLAEARVPTSANLFKSYVVRDGSLLPVDLNKLVKEGDMSQNIVMRSGDKLYIADEKASNLMVLGEVGKQCALPVPNGYMTVREALALAGGIPPTADRRFIQVIRGNVLCPKIYTLNWEHIVRLPSDSLLLIPGDILYVAATPITQWDRFVNQVLPTIVSLDLILKGAKNVGVTLP